MSRIGDGLTRFEPLIRCGEGEPDREAGFREGPSPMQHKILAKLLRAIASGSDAKSKGHDIIFDAAANELERLGALPSQNQTEKS